MLASRWTKLFTFVYFDIGVIAVRRGLLLNLTALSVMRCSVTTWIARGNPGGIYSDVRPWLIRGMLILICRRLLIWWM